MASKSTSSDNRPDSLVTRAQSHLQRIGPVWRKSKDTFYVHGRTMTVDQMVRKAEATGWDSAAWKRIG